MGLKMSNCKIGRFDNPEFVYICDFIANHSNYLIDFFIDCGLEHHRLTDDYRADAVMFCVGHGMGPLLEYIFWQDSKI